MVIADLLPYASTVATILFLESPIFLMVTVAVEAPEILPAEAATISLIACLKVKEVSTPLEISRTLFAIVSMSVVLTETALAEFADVIMFACIATAIFLGGWHLPFVDLTQLQTGIVVGGKSLDPLLQTLLMIGVFLAKSAVLVFVVMWLRWTLPRLRVDQLMDLCWKYLIPIGFFNLLGAAVWVWVFNGKSILELVGGMLGVIR